jgi:streptogramin lyase
MTTPSPGPSSAGPTPTPVPTRSPLPTPTQSPSPFPLLTAPQFRYYPLSGSYPNSIVSPPDGNLWVTLAGFDEVAKLTTNGQIVSYAVPGKLPEALTVAPDGSLWVGERNSNSIAHVTTDGVVRAELPIGNLWYTRDIGGTVVGRMTPSGQSTGFVIPQTAFDITAGRDGNLWLAVDGGVVRLTTAGIPTVYPVPGAGSGYQLHVRSICSASDGNVWAAASTPDQGYALKVALDGTYSVYPAPRFATGGLVSNAIGCVGNTIFLASHVDDPQLSQTLLTEFALDGSIIQTRRVPQTGGFAPSVTSMVLGPDGSLWFVESSNQTVDVWQFR